MRQKKSWPHKHNGRDSGASPRGGGSGKLPEPHKAALVPIETSV